MAAVGIIYVRVPTSHLPGENIRFLISRPKIDPWSIVRNGSCRLPKKVAPDSYWPTSKLYRSNKEIAVGVSVRLYYALNM